jgi:hypothetical protein
MSGVYQQIQELESKMRTGSGAFYHGSKRSLEIGTVLTAKDAKGTFGQLEKLLEKYRPSNKFSRLSSFFLVDKAGDVVFAGGNSAFVYKVEAPKWTKHHFGWFSRILRFFPAYKYDKKIAEENAEAIEEYANLYWSGAPYKKSPDDLGGSTWEYLAPKIKIIREVQG